MKRIWIQRIGAAVLCAVLLAGCMPGGPAADSTASADPLTGQEQQYPGQRPAAVVIDNAPGSTTQWGIGSASVVLEAAARADTAPSLCLVYPSVSAMPTVGPVTLGQDLFWRLLSGQQVLPIQRGCFKFSSTTANTHTVAAKLIEAGCHVEELNTLLFDTKPRARMEAERIARNHLEYYLDGRCALIYLTRDEIRQSGVDPADLEELTSLPISIEGVKVGLTLRQQPGGSYRISVRTAKSVDACAIARRLGGGGHTRAAGCELLGDLENAKNAILAEVEAELDAPQEEA